MPIFGALDDDALECLLEDAPWVHRGAGEYWFREGDAAQCLYVIEQGTVEVQKHWQGRDWPLHRLHTGDCFGEMALMDYCPRSASVLSIEPCRAMAIASNGLHRLAQRNMEQFAMLQMNLGREVCRRLRATDELLFRLRRGEALDDVAAPPLV